MNYDFSIIIPVKSLNDFLKKNIPIIFSMELQNFDLIVLPNEYQNQPIHRPSDSNLLRQDSYFSQIIGNDSLYERITVIPTGKVGPATKRDIGAQYTKAKYLAFLDDDAYPSPTWSKVLIEFINNSEDAIAGPAITPPDAPIMEKASGFVYETILGGGNTRYRYRPGNKCIYVDDYPTVNLVVNRDKFIEVGGFDSKYWPGEDTKFCLDFTRRGYKILYTPDLLVSHHRRTLFRPHIKQITGYATHRGFFFKRFPETSRRLTYVLPTLFTIGVLFGHLMGLIHLAFLYIYFLVIFMYFIINLIDSFRLTKNITLTILTVTGVFLTHIFYGIFFFKGLLTKELKSVFR